jgi:hypothetical protein
MFGAATDLEGLLAHDTTGDGFITADDAIYHQLQIWNDKNGDGKSQQQELTSLSNRGITSIGLEIHERSIVDGEVRESQVLGWSHVFSDGGPSKAYDGALLFEAVGRGMDHGGPWLRASEEFVPA